MKRRRVPSVAVGLCARKQFVALAVAIVGRCGGASGARHLPFSTLSEVGRQWVVAPSRTITLKFQATSLIGRQWVVAPSRTITLKFQATSLSLDGFPLFQDDGCGGDEEDEEDRMYPTVSVVVVMSHTLGFVGVQGGAAPFIRGEVVAWIGGCGKETHDRRMAVFRTGKGALTVREVGSGGAPRTTVISCAPLYTRVVPWLEIVSRGNWIVVCSRSHWVDVWKVDQLTRQPTQPAPMVVVDPMLPHDLLYNPQFVDDNSVAVIQEDGVYGSGLLHICLLELNHAPKPRMRQLHFRAQYKPLRMWCVDSKVYVSAFESETTQKIHCVTTHEEVATLVSKNPISHAWSWYYTLKEDDGRTTVRDVRATRRGVVGGEASPSAVIGTLPGSESSRLVANGTVVDQVSLHSVSLFDALVGVHICTLTTDFDCVVSSF
ncbi:hypothetical protein Pelo_4166 [Pelomyxa schiedti]|nr:hypothetical protein Pelo_4166 [Pelomyxa schiedti]